jgi:hypothetical protein
MNKSEATNEIFAALAKAQGMLRHAAKDAKNPHFKSDYATLASICDAIREPLAANGLAVTQLLSDGDKDDRCYVETVLCHSSGQWVSERFSVPVSKSDAQGFGSAVTYVRRYALAAVTGIAPADDDGNAAAGAAPPKVSKMSDKALADLKASLNEASTLDDLRARTQKALSIAHQGGDIQAHGEIKSYAALLADSMKKAA